MSSEMSGGEEIRRVARLYLEQAQAVSLNGRWAAFTEGELRLIGGSIVTVDICRPLYDEIEAELERRQS